MFAYVNIIKVMSALPYLFLVISASCSMPRPDHRGLELRSTTFAHSSRKPKVQLHMSVGVITSALDADEWVEMVGGHHRLKSLKVRCRVSMLE